MRQLHKTRIKHFLDQIQFAYDDNDNQFLVLDEYATTASKFPFATITSGRMLPNRPNAHTDEFGAGLEYMRGYEYQITVAHLGSESSVPEDEIDEVEALVLDKLQSIAVRNDGAWHDLYVTDISTPLQVDPTISDNLILKTFTVMVEQDVRFTQ